jgi:hypothetical protein
VCDLLKGLLFIAVILMVKFAFEQTSFGERLSLKSHDLLHRPLLHGDTPVSIVDMRDLKPAEFNVGGRNGIATPREPLRRMIEAIAEARPKAIGVLIDFSPDEEGYIHPRDPEFFQFCLDLRRQRGVPVFLGVHRTLAGPPAGWLGVEEYESLAANMLIPKDSRKMLSEIRLGGEGDPWDSRPSGAGSMSSKSMSVALAYAYNRQTGGAPGQPRTWLGAVVEGLRRFGFVETISEKSIEPGLEVSEFSPDFSLLDSIQAVRTVAPAVLRYEARQFEGRVVLIGSGSLDSEQNLFEVPGRDRKYPAIFVHASAVYTLINPRYDVTGRGRLTFDSFFSLTLVLIVVLTGRHYRRGAPGAAAPRRGVLTLAAVIAVMAAGFAFSRATRVTWDDFLAAPAMMFYPSIVRNLVNVLRGLTGRKSPPLHSRPAGVMPDQISTGIIAEAQPESKKVKILLFSAAPAGTGALKLDEEVREIRKKVQAATHRDLIHIECAPAARPADLLEEMNRHEPHVVQFSGHGSEQAGILVCGDRGGARAVGGEALAALFESTRANVQVVVLSACYSREQAEAVASAVPCVIGMRGAIGDRAARVFAAAFYSALCFGRSVEVAFRQGVAALKLEGIEQGDLPDLITRGGPRASEIVPVKP